MWNRARASVSHANAAGGGIFVQQGLGTHPSVRRMQPPLLPLDGRQSMRHAAPATQLLLGSLCGGAHAQTNEQLKS